MWKRKKRNKEEIAARDDAYILFYPQGLHYFSNIRSYVPSCLSKLVLLLKLCGKICFSPNSDYFAEVHAQTKNTCGWIAANLDVATTRRKALTSMQFPRKLPAINKHARDSTIPDGRVNGMETDEEVLEAGTERC